MHDAQKEQESLQLLREIQVELRDALNSLASVQRDGLFHGYIGYSAALVNRAVEGYIFLRESGRFDASKLLVRTALEAAIRVRAVRNKPELLFRIAFTEFEEDKKWLRPFDLPEGEGIQAIDHQWQEFRLSYETQYSDHPLVERRLSLREAAEAIDLTTYYDSHYRLYCKFTHASLRASTGNLNHLGSEDNWTMTHCAFTAVVALVGIGATSPNFASLKERIIPE